jgi:hypothetical protein
LAQGWQYSDKVKPTLTSCAADGSAQKPAAAAPTANVCRDVDRALGLCK